MSRTNAYQQQGQKRYNALPAEDKALVEAQIERNLSQLGPNVGASPELVAANPDIPASNRENIIKNRRAELSEPANLQLLRDTALS